MTSVNKTLKALFNPVIFAPVLFITSLSWLPDSIADDGTIYPLVSYQCNPASDIAVVTNKLLNAEEDAKFNYSDEEGTYSPWDMVEIDRSEKNPKITETRKVTKNCKLSSGDYTITIEPHLFGRKLTGKCGTSISAAVTITYDGVDILERTPFESFCKGNAPVIIRVTTFGKTSEVKIKRIPKYKFY